MSMFLQLGPVPSCSEPSRKAPAIEELLDQLRQKLSGLVNDNSRVVMSWSWSNSWGNDWKPIESLRESSCAGVTIEIVFNNRKESQNGPAN